MKSWHRLKSSLRALWNFFQALIFRRHDTMIAKELPRITFPQFLHLACIYIYLTSSSSTELAGLYLLSWSKFYFQRKTSCKTLLGIGNNMIGQDHPKQNESSFEQILCFSSLIPLSTSRTFYSFLLRSSVRVAQEKHIKF